MFKGKLFLWAPAPAQAGSAVGSSNGQRQTRQTPGKLRQRYHSSFLPSAGHALIFTPELSHKPGASPLLQFPCTISFFLVAVV